MASVASLPLEDRDRDLGDEPIVIELDGESKASRRAQFRLALAFGDVIAIAAGISIASAFRAHDAFDDQVSNLLLAIVPLYLVMALHHRAYGFDSLARFSAGARRALTALLFTALVVMGLGFVLKMGADYSRIIVSLGFALGSLGIVAFRYLFDRYRSRSFPDGLTEEIVLCDGTVLLPSGTERVINATALGIQPRLDCPHMLDRIGRTLRHADRVIIANDNWGGEAKLASIAQTVGAQPLAATSKDAALITTLSPGVYSVVVTDVDSGKGGIALVEVYAVP